MRVLDGAALMFVEMGKENGHNHLHVLHRVGACSLGRKSKVPMKKLMKTAKYLSKAPEDSLENLVAYVEVRRATGKVTKRFRSIRLNLKVEIGHVEEITGLRVVRILKSSKPSSVETQIGPYSDGGDLGLPQSIAASSDEFTEKGRSSLPLVRTWTSQGLIEIPQFLPLMARSYLYQNGRQITVEEIEPVVTREQALDVTLKTLPQSPQRSYGEPQLQVWGNCNFEPVYDLYEPENENLGQSPPALFLSGKQVYSSF